MADRDSLSLDSDIEDPGPSRVKFRKVDGQRESVPPGLVESEDEWESEDDQHQIELVMVRQSDDREHDDIGEMTEDQGDAGWEDLAQPTVGDILGEK